MVFSSFVFLFVFLPTVLLLYYAGPKQLRNLTLTVSSYVFYGWAAPHFIILIAWSTLVDYACGNFIGGQWRLPGHRLSEHKTKKLFVALSLSSNVGLLLFFKYLAFAQENLNVLLRASGAPEVQILLVVLPVGISFYTFESISYTLDIYYGRAQPAIVWVKAIAGNPNPRGLLRLWLELRAIGAFACYITQFPHLVAGPIIRYQDLEKQIHVRTHTWEKFARGVGFLALGLSKKILLANPSGDIADLAFEARALGPFDAWFGLLAYSFQIYFDFSGYSDMAIGLALMFGLEFRKNFDSPYKAQSVTDFWRRWHISLSTWLRDYVYVPLGGNRKGPVRTYLNLVTVMLIGGLWHGASWNFLIWGAIHGAWLIVERLQGKTSWYAKAPAPLRVAITFSIVSLAWVFFRAPDLTASLTYLGHMVGLSDPRPDDLVVRAVMFAPFNVVCLTAAAVVAFFGVQTWDWTRRMTPPRAVVCTRTVRLVGRGHEYPVVQPIPLFQVLRPMADRHHDETAHDVMANVQVSARTARLVAVIFCGLLLVPVGVEVSRPAPRIWDLLVQDLAKLGPWTTLRQSEQRVIFESAFARLVRDPYQRFLIDWWSQGSRTIVVGRGGLLFHRDDIMVVSGRGLLSAPPGAAVAAEADPLAELVKYVARGWRSRPLAPPETAPTPSATSVEVLSNLNAELRRRAIDLVVVVVPSKAMVYPEFVAARYPTDRGPAMNRDHASWTEALAARGVNVLDLSHVLWEAKQAPGVVFSPLDSHWSPTGLSVAADAVARRIAETLPGVTVGRPTMEPFVTTSPFDLLWLLGLRHAPRTLPASEMVLPVPPKPAAGVVARRAPIVLFGDSLAGYYRDMAVWGDASFPRQLGARLGLDVEGHVGYGDDMEPLVRRMLMSRGFLDDRKMVIIETGMVGIVQGRFTRGIVVR